MKHTKGITIDFEDPYHTPKLSQMSVTVFGDNLAIWLDKLSKVYDRQLVILVHDTSEDGGKGFLHIGHQIYKVSFKILYNVYI